MSKRIFNYDDKTESKIINSLREKHLLYTNTISACGCLFYRIRKSKLQLLLISYADKDWPRYDDFGGMIDVNDKSLIHAIARETAEETNNIISKNYLKSIISMQTRNFYNKQSKYYNVVLQVDKHFYSDTSIFGEFEHTDEIYRTIKWMDYNMVKSNLALRLLNNVDLINYLDLLT